jgi:hypothetical protein
MLEAGVPFSVVATIMGWSPSTTVRMSRRYGHIGQNSERLAVNALKEAGIQDDGAQPKNVKSKCLFGVAYREIS